MVANLHNEKNLDMKNRIITIYALLFLSANLIAGGGWTKKKGDGYYKLSEYIISWDQFLNDESELIDIPQTSIYSTSFYGEYGISDRLNVLAYIPLFVHTNFDNPNKLVLPQYETEDSLMASDQLSGIGDPDITLKYGFLRTSTWVGAVSLTAGLPLGERDGGDSRKLQTGDGEFNQMLTVEVSRPLGQKGFGSALLGYNNRTNNYSSEIRYGLEAGVNVKEKLWLTLKIYGVSPINNDDDEIPLKLGIFNNRVQYMAISPEISYFITDKFGVSLGAGFAGSASRIIAAPSLTFGAFIDIKK